MNDTVAVIFFCIVSTLADCLYISKWLVLCCPDFPLLHTQWWSSDKSSICFQCAKVHILFKEIKDIHKNVNAL